MDSDRNSGRESEIEPRSGLSSNAIRDQLDRILASPEFHATDKVRDFLRYIVEEKLEGRAQRLKAYTIALAVFGRDKNFDGTNDPIVRIQAGRLRRSLERYYLAAGTTDPILIDIPKGRYIPRFAAPAAQQDAMRPYNGGMPWNRCGEPAVVVLPVQDLSDMDSDPSLATGLTNEIVTELTRFQDIRVVSCYRAQQPAGFPADPVDIGRSLDARFVLECLVRRDATYEKVSAHLVDTSDGTRVWAEAFSHPLEASSLIATQEQIARKVVSAVASEYGIIARKLSCESRKKRPADLETYEAMLRYYDHQVSPTPQSAESCFTALQAAAAREPDYGPLWSALATLHCQVYSFDIAGFEDPLDTALEFARRGVHLDSGSQLARLILAYASHLADDVEDFNEECEVALSLNPNSTYTVGSIGYLYSLRGELDVGLRMLNQAMTLNPCGPSWFHAGHVIDYLLKQDFEHALMVTRTYHPFISYWDDVMIAAILGSLGRADEARPHVDAIRNLKPDLEGRSRDLMRRSLKIDNLVECLAAGLHRVGLAA